MPTAVLVAAKDETIARLDAEVAYLRAQLDHGRRELAAERERFDVLHREALARIPAVGPGENAPPAPVQRAEFGAERGQGAAEGGKAGTETPTGGAPQEPPRRAWWRVRERGRPD
jgi:hypothetical protein